MKRARHAPRIRIALGARRWIFALSLLALAPAVSQASSFSSDDPCLSFLSSGFSSGPSGETSQRTAGVTSAAGKKAATLSLLLGLQTALRPVEDLNGGQTGPAARPEITALDIRRYRTCKKEQALRVSWSP